jgi:hypothetical protein
VTALLSAIALICGLYLLGMYLVMRRTLSWRYKAFIYGLLTFLMLMGVFCSFRLFEPQQPGAPRGCLPGRSRA